MKKAKMTVADWLSINQEPDLAKHRWAGAVISTVLVLLGLFVVLACLAHFFMAVLVIGPYADDIAGAGIRNVGLLLAAVVGLPFLVWRSVVNQKQVNIAEQGHITETINKAVKGLGAEKTVKKVFETPRFEHDGNDWIRDEDDELIPAVRPDGSEIIKREVIEQTVPNLEVRIGAIYALERIAKDSLRDHLQIMEILCAYVRENAPAGSLEPSAPGTDRAVPRTDIQAAITVIGRRSPEQIALEWENEFRLDLRRTDLSGVSFLQGNFSAAQLYYCRLEGANFRKSKLAGTMFNHSLLSFIDFFEAELKGTRFDHVTQCSDFMLGKIYGISVVGADLSEISYLGETEVTNLIYGTKDTQLHGGLMFDEKTIKQLSIDVRRLHTEGKIQEAEELTVSTEFGYWSPFDSAHSTTEFFRENFLYMLDLKGWPYQ
ncbi:MAG: pentapeptide repeat-containing protein [Sneathiella sp.]